MVALRQNHTGAVIKFLALPEVDSSLIVAQPVQYTTRMPRREFASMLDFQKSLAETVALITLTKSDVWGYEKEWRIVAGLRDKTQSYEILSYAPEEVGAVYLGFKMAEDDKEELIEITRRYIRRRHSIRPTSIRGDFLHFHQDHVSITVVTLRLLQLFPEPPFGKRPIFHKPTKRLRPTSATYRQGIR